VVISVHCSSSIHRLVLVFSLHILLLAPTRSVGISLLVWWIGMTRVLSFWCLHLEGALLRLRGTSILAVSEPVLNCNTDILIIVVKQVANIGDTSWGRHMAKFLVLDQLGFDLLIS